MSKIIKLTESDLTKIVRQVIKEQTECTFKGNTHEFKSKNGEKVIATAMSEPYNAKVLTSDQGGKVGSVIPYQWMVLVQTEEGNRFEVLYDCKTKKLTSNNGPQSSYTFEGQISKCKCR